MKILKKLKNKIYLFMPVSRAELHLTLENINKIVDGLSIADEQHGQMIMSMLQELEALKIQQLASTQKSSTKSKNGSNGVNKSYA